MLLFPDFLFLHYQYIIVQYTNIDTYHYQSFGYPHSLNINILHRQLSFWVIICQLPSMMSRLRSYLVDERCDAPSIKVVSCSDSEVSFCILFRPLIISIPLPSLLLFFSGFSSSSERITTYQRSKPFPRALRSSKSKTGKYGQLNFYQNFDQ